MFDKKKTEIIQAIINKIKVDPSQAEYFFKNKELKSLLWFIPLYENDCLTPKKENFEPKEISGKFYNQFWFPLSYLERIASGINKTEDVLERESHLSKLFKIIDDVLEVIGNNNIDNFYILTSLINIISQLDPNDISGEFINKLFSIALNKNHQNTSFFVNSVVTKLLLNFISPSSTKDDILKFESIITKLLEISKEDESVNDLLDSKFFLFINEVYLINKLKKVIDSNVDVVGKYMSGYVLACIHKQVKTILVSKKLVVYYEVDSIEYRIVLNMDMSNIIFINIFKNEKNNINYQFSLDSIKNISPKVMASSFRELVFSKILEASPQVISEDNSPLPNNIFEQLLNIDTYDSFYEEKAYIAETTSTLVDILSAFINAGITQLNPVVTNYIDLLLSEKHFFFQKLLIYTLGKDFKKSINAQSLFWTLITEDRIDIAQNAIYAGEELKKLFSQIEADLIPAKCQILNDKIKNDIDNSPLTQNDDGNRLFQSIYESLKHVAYFKILHEEIKNKTTMEYQLHPLIGKFHSGWIKDAAPLSADELCLLPVSEELKFLKDYKPTETQDFFNPINENGLAEELKKSIIMYPLKYWSNLESFMRLNLIYVRFFLSGIIEILKSPKHKEIDWNINNTLPQILSVIKRNNYQDKTGQDEYNGKYILSEIAEMLYFLIDNKIATIKNYDVISELYSTICTDLKTKADKTIPKEEEVIQRLINDALGRVLDKIALLIVHSRHEGFGKLFSIIQNYFDAGYWQAYSVVGFYFYWFWDKESEWVKKVINSEIIGNDNFYYPFMHSYLWRNLSDPVRYKFLQNYYEKALKNTFPNNIQEVICNHISMAYIYGEGDFLINKIIDVPDIFLIRKTIFYIGKQGEENLFEGTIEKTTIFPEYLSYKDRLAEIFQSIDNDIFIFKETISKDDIVSKFGNNVPQELLNLLLQTLEDYKNTSLDKKKETVERVKAFYNLISVEIKKMEDSESKSQLWANMIYLYYAFIFDEKKSLEDEAFLFLLKAFEIFKNPYDTVNIIKKMISINKSKIFINDIAFTKQIADFFSNILNNNFPIYPEEDVVEIVEYIYSSSEKKTEAWGKANKICNKYLENGSNLLVALYSKYNQ